MPILTYAFSSFRNCKDFYPYVQDNEVFCFFALPLTMGYPRTDHWWAISTFIPFCPGLEWWIILFGSLTDA